MTGTVAHADNPCTWKAQEDCPRSEAGLGHIVWPGLRKLRNTYTIIQYSVLFINHTLNSLYFSYVFRLSFSVQVYIWALFNPWLKVNVSTFISRILIVIIIAYVYTHKYTSLLCTVLVIKSQKNWDSFLLFIILWKTI